MQKQLSVVVPELQALQYLSSDGRILFAARLVRMAAFGGLSVVVALYLAALGLTEPQIGLLFTATLIGDAVLSLWIASAADRLGRRTMLFAAICLMIAAGLAFLLTENLLLLTLFAVIGTMSPNGAEVGPFLSIEQAILPQTTTPQRRTAVFGWYNLIALSAKAVGSLGGGALVGWLQQQGTDLTTSYRAVILAYVLLSVILFLFTTRLSPQVEVQRVSGEPARVKATLGLHRSRGIVFHLSALFALDAFAGGLIIQSFLAYWFALRFEVAAVGLGLIFFGVNLLGGISTLVAARVAARFGLINTMVWTHIPSNIILLCVPLMPTLPLAVVLLLARSSISQMDVPTRQSYTMAVVDPDERSAAAGFTSIVRSVGSAAGPALTGLFFSLGWLSAPFFVAGTLKIAYDLMLYRSFVAIKPPEENPA